MKFISIPGEYLISAILEYEKKHFSNNFVNFMEINFFQEELNQYFKENEKSLYLSDEVSDCYFIRQEGGYLEKKKFCYGLLPGEIDIYLIHTFDDESLMLDILFRYKEEELKTQLKEVRKLKSKLNKEKKKVMKKEIR